MGLDTVVRHGPRYDLNKYEMVSRFMQFSMMIKLICPLDELTFANNVEARTAPTRRSNRSFNSRPSRLSGNQKAP